MAGEFQVVLFLLSYCLKLKIPLHKRAQSPPDERPLPKVYEEIMGGPLVVGDRGGIICDNTLPHIAFEAEEGHQLS